MTSEIVNAERNTLATTSIILGVVSVLSVGLLGVMLAFLIGIAAIVTGFISLKQIKEKGQKGQGLAVFGIILGFLPILVVVLLAMLGPAIGNVFSNITSQF